MERRRKEEERLRKGVEEERSRGIGLLGDEVRMGGREEDSARG